MDKWPEVFSDIISNAKDAIKHDPFGESVVNGIIGVDIKVEDPQPYMNPNPSIPTPEVKE